MAVDKVINGPPCAKSATTVVNAVDHPITLNQVASESAQAQVETPVLTLHDGQARLHPLCVGHTYRVRAVGSVTGTIIHQFVAQRAVAYGAPIVIESCR